MSYEKTAIFNREPKAALETAKTILLPNGFQIIEFTVNSVILKNDCWLQKQNNALSSISQIDIRIENSTISLKAELGTIKKILVFLVIFLVFLAAFLAIVFAIMFSKNMELSKILVLSLVPFAPWPILVPLIYFFLKVRANKALDILLSNMTCEQVS
jgi:hypothetical protein